ncbi:oligosaccharide flippase family protein [Undibacterium terreum]|uniref:Polysaccharide pyruvyl transferase domain-containing protein n=1 Tax=Undibacterium terreum TaxID=1224302 RepID=A0A916XQK0_9BURK|nr:oligosaccharide flippase family protein [Undibacterium terreum]GGC97025.1 hypothetical protein GCM10011396_50630 [Undibacterium terreum]
MSLVLSRLLSPSEIGIFSITAVLVSFTHVFRDFGVAAFIRRQKILSDDVLRASIGVLFTSSWIIAALLYISADYCAIYFKQPGIVQIMHIQAIGFLIIPFGSIPQAVLSRTLEVEKTTIVTFISVIVYATTCITLAYMGFSYMSMAWANLLNIIASSAGLMLLSPKGLPRMPSFKGWKRVVHFGAGAMTTSALKAVDAALPDILLGKISGTHDVGIFSRGNSTVNIFNSIATPTVNYFALPYLAKAHHGGANVGQEVGRSIALLSGIMWPALIVMAVMASSVITLLYGEAWVESATIVPWLCVCAAIQIGFVVLQPALTALNKPYLSAFPIALLVIVKITLGIASFDGDDLISFARAVAIAEMLAIPIYLYLLDRHVGLKVVDWFKAISSSLKICVLILAQVLLLKFAIQTIHQPLIRILLAALWITPGWLFAVFLFKHPLQEEVLTAWAYIKSHFPTNATRRPMAKAKSSSRIIIYGAVSARAATENTWQTFKSSTRISLARIRDILFWRLGSLRHLQYKNYLTLGSINRGDEAITAATRQQLLRHDPYLEFIDVNWGDLGTAIAKEAQQGIDLIVIAGSGYISLDGKGNLSERIEEDLKALHRTAAPMVLYGIGVNQLLESRIETDGTYVAESSATNLRDILSRASFISVRDDASRTLLGKFTHKPISLTGDPALYYLETSQAPDQHQPAEQHRPIIGINFAMHGPAANARLKRNFPVYVTALKKLQKLSNCKYVYFEHYGAEQIIPTLLSVSGIHTEIVSGDPDVLTANYARVNLHIGEMLHSNILATSAGAPTIALAYDIKHTGFFSLLDIQRNCFSSVEFDPELVVETAQEILTAETIVRARIKARRELLEIDSNLFIAECLSLTAPQQIKETALEKLG